MLKNIIVLPDGTEISSGLGQRFSIQNVTVTESVNSGDELTPGSVCSSALEAVCFTPGGGLSVTVGTEVTLYKERDGQRTKVGLFTMEAPERPGKNTYRFTAYDRVSWLNKDLTAWLAGLTGWPYTLQTFAQMVCRECLLTLSDQQIPNGSFPVQKFTAGTITGRQIMGYIGEIAGRFCRATADGLIEFAWYEESGITLEATGENYYLTMKREDYVVEGIDAVQVRLADSEYGLLFPEVSAGKNSYVITENPLISAVNSDLMPYLNELQRQLVESSYTPCRVTLPANLNVRPGQILRIIDGNGNVLETYVMTKTQRGQKETIESTGSVRRDRPTVGQKQVNDANAVLNRLTQQELFNRLTNNGQVQGIFLGNDGQIYINAEYINSGQLNAALITAGILQSFDGETFKLDLDKGTFSMSGSGKFMAPDGKSYVTVENGQFVLNAQSGEYGQVLDIVRIGFTEDSEGLDYPYILMGNSENAGEDQDKIGLVKMFRNGLYIGNSAPRLSSGSFVGLNGAAGFFIDTVNAVAYVVQNNEMRELYTGTVDATFA